MAGAGPTGLALACGLRMAGVSVRVIDKAERPSVASRALGLQPRGSEVLNRLGALGDLPERSVRMAEVATHVNGRCLVRLRVGRYAALTSWPVLVNSQAEVETRLRRRLGDLGVEVEWGRELLGADQDGGGVTVQLTDGTVRTEWLVGCDGAHSRVRKVAGIAFPGASVVERFLLADVRAALPLMRDTASVWLRKDQMLAVFPLPGGDLWRVVASAPPDGGDDVDSGGVAAVLRRELATHAGVDPSAAWEVGWTSVFGIQRRLADEYRRGRILLAGDAAHIHSPFGGQGMNTGLGDAENLAWKLALVASGRARDGLLDTYEAERRPVAREVVASTSGLTRLVLGESLPARAVRDHALVPLLRRPVVQRLLWEKSSQLKVGYRKGPLASRWPRLRSAVGSCAGDRVPDVECIRDDGSRTRLHAELGSRWAIIAPPADAQVYVDHARRRLGGAAAVAALSSSHAHGRRVMLVRPDAHLAWSGTAPAALDAWLARTLGDGLPRTSQWQPSD
ncbi:FAD-dependent monooxygenase [Peterkaempfera bronchialis]|uniref:FAD-dependent monooxygenase n=1 Tax=Peterkaempfera bronchialis TaxID=2126346 RepID=UPI003C2F2D5C